VTQKGGNRVRKETSIFAERLLIYSIWLQVGKDRAAVREGGTVGKGGGAIGSARWDKSAQKIILSGLHRQGPFCKKSR